MQLLKLLEGRNFGQTSNCVVLELLIVGLNTPIVNGDGEHIGVGLDSCVVPTRHKGLSLIQTTDLYPSFQNVHTLVLPFPLVSMFL